MLIRHATFEDIPQLAGLVRLEIEQQQALAGCFQLASHVNWSGYVSAKIKASDTGIIVAAEDGRLVGYIEARIVYPGGRIKSWLRQCIPLFRPSASPLGIIEDVYVIPTQRRMGIAQMLLEAACDWLNGQQARFIEGYIWWGNDAALNFMELNDFIPVQLIMRKNIAAE